MEPVVACDQASKPPANKTTGSRLKIIFLIVIDRSMRGHLLEIWLVGEQSLSNSAISEGCPPGLGNRLPACPNYTERVSAPGPVSPQVLL
jgi:hypothetical protein